MRVRRGRDSIGGFDTERREDWYPDRERCVSPSAELRVSPARSVAPNAGAHWRSVVQTVRRTMRRGRSFVRIAARGLARRGPSWRETPTYPPPGQGEGLSRLSNKHRRRL